MRDHLGEWWIASAQGLVRYRKLSAIEQLAHLRPDVIFTTLRGLPANEVFRIFEDSRGDIWKHPRGVRRDAARWVRATAKEDIRRTWIGDLTMRL